MTSLTVPGLPFPLVPEGSPPCAAEVSPDGSLRLTGRGGTDLFADPAGSTDPLPDAGRLTGVPPAGDFTLSARVGVDFTDVYDAGALLLHASERRWAKLAFEFSPQQRPTAVTVVTRGTSDDCNSFETDERALWLRITRAGAAWAFHAATGEDAPWRLLRYFSLGEHGERDGAEPVSVGFLAQSPLGKGCTAGFTGITFAPGAPGDLRDGS
ncbi:DUF1349 domain-containing protein [Streptomyces lycii]|uniref:DUF1349 domain-containing protein n=1 Tax=Streptomyces lycii TaxID=2654337 RepID=A0ABQ7FFZ1_9ACTN|nr:DUF1349 domain-containing protein [Streptomyces lycii]KAF4406761.1 DUF1349 domain-containing protein [Streptomyces lycii]